MKELIRGFGFFTAIMTNNYIIFELGKLCAKDEIREKETLNI
jgi:hypothetical protein